MTQDWGCREKAKQGKARTRESDRRPWSKEMDQISDVQNARNWLKEACHCAHLRTVVSRALDYSEAVERAGLDPVNLTGQDLYEFLTDERVRAAFVRAFPQPSL